MTARESAASMREHKRKDVVAAKAKAVKREVEEARDDGTDDEDEIPNHVATGAATACTSMTGVIARGGMAIVTSSFYEEELKTLGSGDDKDIPTAKRAAMASRSTRRPSRPLRSTSTSPIPPRDRSLNPPT